MPSVEPTERSSSLLTMTKLMPTAISAVLRDAARYGVLAVGMSFVIIAKELDLSGGSTWGLVFPALFVVFAPTLLHLHARTAALVWLGIRPGVWAVYSPRLNGAGMAG